MFQTFNPWAPVLSGEAAPSKSTASLAVAGVAVAALSVSGRKAIGSIKTKQLVALSAVENELGVQAPVGSLCWIRFWIDQHPIPRCFEVGGIVYSDLS